MSERYWDAELCRICQSEEEADELQDGRPVCKINGVCKHLSKGDPLLAGLACDPNLLLAVTGLSRPLETLRKLSCMDVDSLGLPTLKALGWLDFEIDLSTDDFADLIGPWLSNWRETVARKRENGRR